MRTVFEEAIRIGETTFPAAWRLIQERVAEGASHEAIASALQSALKRPMSQKFWGWVEDATTAAKNRTTIEADARRRQFRVVTKK